MSGALSAITALRNFTASTNTYTTAGSSAQTIPNGAQQCIIRAWGAGGGGARINASGSGGGGGGGVKKTIAIASSDWGQTISYTVGAKGIGKITSAGNGTAGGNTTVTSAGLSFTNLNLAAGGGGAGNTVDVGPGGTASGGDTNNLGVDGAFGNSGPPAGGNSATLDGIFGSHAFPGANPGGGGDSRINADAGNGADGRVDFVWS